MNTTIKEKVMKDIIDEIISKNLRDGRLYSITFLTNDLFELFQLTEQEKNREFLEMIDENKEGISLCGESNVDCQAVFEDWILLLKQKLKGEK